MEEFLSDIAATVAESGGVGDSSVSVETRPSTTTTTTTMTMPKFFMPRSIQVLKQQKTQAKERKKVVAHTPVILGTTSKAAQPSGVESSAEAVAAATIAAHVQTERQISEAAAFSSNYDPETEALTKPLPTMPPPAAEPSNDEKSEDSANPKTAIVRTEGGEVWKDDTLTEWPEDDFRLFVGNLGKEVTDSMLQTFFQAYKSLAKVKVIRKKKTGEPAGYGFASFLTANDYAQAFRDLDGKFCGSHPVQLKRSNWRDRNVPTDKLKKVQVPSKRQRVRKPGKTPPPEQTLMKPKKPKARPWMKEKNSWMGEGMM